MAEYTRAGLPIVTEELAGKVREQSAVTGLEIELESARASIRSDNPHLAGILEDYLGEMPEPYINHAVSAALLVYHVLERQSEENNGMVMPSPNTH